MKLSLTNFPGSATRMYCGYWLAYLMIFGFIEGLQTREFGTSFTTEAIALLPKIVFVLLINEWLAPGFLFVGKVKDFVTWYLVSLIAFAVLLRIVDNHIILRWFLKHWQAESLLSPPPLLYNIIKLQFVVSIPFLFKYVNHKKNLNEPPVAGPTSSETDFMILKSDRQLVRIVFDDIDYLEAQRNYLLISTTGNMSKVYQSMSAMEQRLPSEKFLRIHRSFIISRSKLDAYNSTHVTVSGKQLPVGRVYKERVAAVFGGR